MKNLATVLITISLYSTTVFSQLNIDIQKKQNWVDSIFNKMSDNEKIGQLFMVAAYSNNDLKHEESIKRLIKKNNIGGLIFFKGEPEKQVALTNTYQQLSETPLFIAIDGEWGLSMRLSNTPKYPRQLTLGAIRDNKLIYQMGEQIAEQCHRMGIHINFAPVVDINTNPNNPVINSRSFGENKYNVAYKGLAYANGLQNNNILPTAKHFPGHGDTQTDSHKTLPIISHNRNRLDSIELYPFKTLFDNGIKGVMVAHLNVPVLNKGKSIASTLSKSIVTDLLKNEMDFDGLIFTDALNMKGVSKTNSPGQLEVKALIAGNDVLLYPEDVPKAILAIKKAIKQKKLNKADLFNRSKKILAAKYDAMIESYRFPTENKLISDLNKPQYEALILELFKKATTLLTNKDEIIPIKNLDKKEIANLAIGRSKDGTFQQFNNFYTNVDSYYIKDTEDLKNIDLIINKLQKYNTIIISIHNTSQYSQKSFGINSNTGNIIRRVCSQNNTIINLFGNPYGLNKLGDISTAKAVIVSYEDDKRAEEAASQIIFGGSPALGQLPVSTDYYNEGEGLITEKTRLGFSLPSQLNIEPDSLFKIDTIVLNAIKEMAMPGCQIVAAKDGDIFLHKSYGYHTYQKRKAVEESDLYDVASVTKIAATIPSLMILYDQGKFSPDKPLCYYLPYIKGSNKENLHIKKILTHQAGLVPWINFYLRTMEPLVTGEELFSKTISPTFSLKASDNIFLNKNFKYKQGYFSTDSSNLFPIRITQSLYACKSIKDTIFDIINKSELREPTYKYSDLGYYYFKEIIENQTNNTLDEFTNNNLYKKLGCTSTYLPLNKTVKEKIIPTENDVIYRKQLLHGTVHDPGASLLGGVGGHAGLFSNALDLAKLMQMYLNKGYYGGDHFINKNTVNYFTQYQYLEQDNRRGLGFDKQNPKDRNNSPVCQSASVLSFGHSGFTGTIVWADPLNNLVYIFLSNRVHPDQYNMLLISNNIRTDIQETLYKAIRKDW